MALRSHDRTLADLDDGCFDDIWQNDLIHNSSEMTHALSTADELSSTSSDTMDPNWLDLLFDDPILNDRMISDALEPHVVQSEHSYSIGNCCKMETVVIKDEPMDKDYEIDVLSTDTDSPSASHDEKSPLHAYGTAGGYQHGGKDVMDGRCEWKSEPMDDGRSYGGAMAAPSSSSSYYTSRSSPNGRQTLLKQNVLQSSRGHDSPNVRLHNVDIHLELVKSECTGQYGLPPTPPSSSTSDSEGGQSPQRSAPSSPSSRQSARSSPRSLSSQSMFISPVNAAGMLVLTEEEKRTLIAEGYPIPSKLPLSKADERNLKKVRRKIKNKISAQESRRKKKEYMECLEKRMEGYSRENEGLRKKVDYLESSNRSLMSQLQKLQNLVSRVPRPSPQSTPTGSCLMVLVLFFAVFLGSWSPMSWSIGSFQVATSTNVPLPMSRAYVPLTKPEAIQPIINDYHTPNMRSRVLLSMQDEPDDGYEEDITFGPLTPSSGKDYFLGLFSRALQSCGVTTSGVSNVMDDAVKQPSLPEIAMVMGLHGNGKQTDEPVGISDTAAVPKVQVAGGVMPNGTQARRDTRISIYFHHCDISANCSA